MSLFSNAVRFIKERKKSYTEQSSVDGLKKNTPSVVDPRLELNFSIRNYAKESFSVLIVKPISVCLNKILRSLSFLITGVLSGIIIALVCFLISLQFGSVENSIVSSLIVNKLGKLLPDSDLAIKSAMLNWDKEHSAIEINLKKVRIENFIFPKVVILPDYTESIKQQRFIAKSVSLVNPKIAVDIDNDFKSITFNPNFEKGQMNKALFEPLSSFEIVKDIFDKNTLLKLVNTNVQISENGLVWDLKNTYCEYKLDDVLPSIFSCSTILPKQKYSSNIKIEKLNSAEKTSYDVKFSSVNPSAIYNAFAKRNLPIEYVMSVIEGYNLPVSGDMKINFDKNRLKDFDFDLTASEGAIKLPNRNTFSLNLGKKIDSGSISGTFLADKALIKNVNISYGNANISLVGIEIPTSNFRLLDLANIDGTLSLTNIGVKDMASILPTNISKSFVPFFKSYLPEFKLDMFKVDVRGPIAFGNRMGNEPLDVGNGVFKIHDAQVSIGGTLATNVDATGSIMRDGIDIKLSNATFNKTKINNGIFFVSNKDNSWIGKINADVSMDEISSYAKDVSKKLASLPIDKLDIKGIANLDLKLVRVANDKLQSKKLPFRVVEGNGVVKSDDNLKNLKLSWSDDKLSIVGNVSTEKNSIHMQLDENLAENTGTSVFKFVGNSGFLGSLVPIMPKWFSGNFTLDVNNKWDNENNNFDISIDLKDTSVTVPVIGNVKQMKDDGIFKAHIESFDDKFVVSRMSLVNKNSKINGQMTFSKEGEIIECALDDLVLNGCSSKINLIKKSDNLFLLSLLGDSLSSDSLKSVFNYLEKDTQLRAYINLKTVNLSELHDIRNVKGTLDILGKKVVGGSCIGVIGKDTTVALTAKDIDGTNDYLMSISASNAGEFLKHIGIADTIDSGSINFVVKSSKTADYSLSGAFEIKDFIVKNNKHLNNLISLSSTSWVQNSGDFVVGFNTCTGNIIATKENIKIENCKAISPTMAISLDGEYDRLEDAFKGRGISLPIAGLNNGNSNGIFAADYNLSGSLGSMYVSVQNPRRFTNEALQSIFGDLISLTPARESYSDSYADYDPDAKYKDPYSEKAFDSETKKKAPKKNQGTISTDKKFGVTINRGLKK